MTLSAPTVTAQPSTSKSLKIYLVSLDSEHDFDPAGLARRLNRAQSRLPWRRLFRFHALAHAPIFKTLKRCSSFRIDKMRLCDGEEILKDIARHATTLGIEADSLVIAVASVYIGWPQGGETPKPEDFYLGIWRNDEVPINVDKRFALLSSAAWEDKYERLGYRNTDQYLAFLTVAYLGDYLVDGGLTHVEFNKCVFDFNEEQDSVVHSVRKSRICPVCTDRLRKLKTVSGLDARRVSAALSSILQYSRRPPPWHIIRSFQEDPVFSIFVTGFVMSVITSVLANYLQNYAQIGIGLSAVFLLAMVSWFLLRRYHPTGRLG